MHFNVKLEAHIMRQVSSRLYEPLHQQFTGWQHADDQLAIRRRMYDLHARRINQLDTVSNRVIEHLRETV